METNSQKLDRLEKRAQKLRDQMDMVQARWEITKSKMKETNAKAYGHISIETEDVPSEWTVHCIETGMASNYRFHDILA